MLRFGLSLAANAFLTNLEPPPLKHIRISTPANAGAVTKELRNAKPDGLVKFARGKSRAAVLSAARSYLRAIEGHEELIVFIGRRRGNGAVFDGFWLNRGDHRGVGFTELAVRTIYQQARGDKCEIVVVHNHPPNDLKSFLAMLFG